MYKCYRDPVTGRVLGFQGSHKNICDSRRTLTQGQPDGDSTCPRRCKTA